MGKYVCIPMTVGGRYFGSKTELEDFISNTLFSFNVNPLGKRFNDYHFAFMESLFQRHPWSKHLPPVWDITLVRGCGEKGRGCAEPVNRYGRCILLHFSTGDKACLNFKHCIKPIPGVEYVMQALRDAVYNDIRKLRRSLTTDQHLVCATCNTVTHTKHVQMDHVPPNTFEQLAWSWVWEMGLDINTIEIEPYMKPDFNGKMHRRWRMLDKIKEAVWAVYHGARARLRPLCHRCHKQASENWYSHRIQTVSQSWDLPDYKPGPAPARPKIGGKRVPRRVALERKFARRG